MNDNNRSRAQGGAARYNSNERKNGLREMRDASAHKLRAETVSIRKLHQGRRALSFTARECCQRSSGRISATRRPHSTGKTTTEVDYLRGK
jgi:hypothetical protein